MRATGLQQTALQIPLTDPLVTWPTDNWTISFFQVHDAASMCGKISEVVATACSGTGAPSYALQELVGRHNFSEVISSEKHATCLKEWYTMDGVVRVCFFGVSSL